MIGEMLCHITGFLQLPFEVVFFIIGLIWFTAGWVFNGIRLNRRWIKSLDVLEATSKNRVIKDVHTKRKRNQSTKGATEI